MTRIRNAARLRSKSLLSTALCAVCLPVGFAAAPASAAVVVTDDPALYWSSLVSSTISGSPILTSRSVAMAQIAIFEAANLTTGKQYKSYLGFHASSGDTRAAVAVAARNVLVAVNPSQTAQYDAALAATLALVTDGAAKDQGMALGNAIASATLAKRLGDGSNLTVPYMPQAPGTPGAWQPTPPAFGPALFPQWQNVTPWAMTSTDQFLPPPPPALDSVTYAIDFNEVKEWGSLGSVLRTADQTNSALVWQSTPGGLVWHNVAIELAQGSGMDTGDLARMFALLAMSNADAVIATWDAKYHYDFWRPYTAIRNADIDGNLATIADPAWVSRINNPAYPSYSSGLSALAGNGTAVLSSFFGDATSFCVMGTAGQRCFTSFAQAAQEAADSRIYGGIHFRFENTAGLNLGRNVAHYTLENALGVVPEPATWSLLILGFGVIGAGLRRTRRAWPKLRYAT